MADNYVYNFKFNLSLEVCGMREKEAKKLMKMLEDNGRRSVNQGLPKEFVDFLLLNQRPIMVQSMDFGELNPNDILKTISVDLIA